MDVSPGPFEGMQQTPQQRPQAAADQGPSPASVQPRTLWETASEPGAHQAVPEPVAVGNCFSSKTGLSRFAPNASSSAGAQQPAEAQGFRFQSQPLPNCQPTQNQSPPTAAYKPDGRGQHEPGQASAASKARAASAAASTAAGEAAATAAAAAQVSDAQVKGAAASLVRLAAGFAKAAGGEPSRAAAGHTAATATPSATSPNGQDSMSNCTGDAAGAPAQSSNAPNLETAFRQSLHVGAKPAHSQGQSAQVGQAHLAWLRGFLKGTNRSPFSLLEVHAGITQKPSC